ncbi:hypothetical protein LINGRAHAP2_LOCUS14096 [Linum grandiflorum]
MMISRLKLFQ